MTDTSVERKALIKRQTKETDIEIELNLDECSEADIDTGVGFLDHMLSLFAAHGDFGLRISCKGDYHIDYHHTVEDVGICLGKAFDKALLDRKGIERYGYMILPMDEALILAAVDISGRTSLNFDLDIKAQKVGSFDTELIKEFFLAFTRACPMSIHLKSLAGENTHHVIEGGFKAFARAMKQAVKLDDEKLDKIPSTKGLL